MALFDFSWFTGKRRAADQAAHDLPREVIYIPTRYGDCEAHNRWGDEWIISYPWETQQFYGNKESVQAEMNRRIEDRYGGETKVAPTTVYIPTGSGDAKATHVALNRWKIEYPWATEDFTGNMNAVRKEMKRKIIERYTPRPSAEAAE